MSPVVGIAAMPLSGPAGLSAVAAVVENSALSKAGPVLSISSLRRKSSAEGLLSSSAYLSCVAKRVTRNIYFGDASQSHLGSMMTCSAMAKKESPLHLTVQVPIGCLGSALPSPLTLMCTQTLCLS